MSRSTGVFQQQELQEKLRRLEQEIARAKAATEEMNRRAQPRPAEQGPASPPSAAPTKTRDSEPKP
jgi:hypothetical protein